MGQYPRRGLSTSNLRRLLIATMMQVFGGLFTIGGIVFDLMENKRYKTNDSSTPAPIDLKMVGDCFLGFGVILSTLGMWALRS
jgi:hypothetical protein